MARINVLLESQTKFGQVEGVVIKIYGYGQKRRERNMRLYVVCLLVFSFVCLYWYNRISITFTHIFSLKPNIDVLVTFFVQLANL